ncbi:MAG: DUF2232 domain-containing protein [Clostridia bacterium]|nr:DUF2232 domain-containing protein [Clostridia bacterium]
MDDLNEIEEEVQPECEKLNYRSAVTVSVLLAVSLVCSSFFSGVVSAVALVISVACGAFLTTVYPYFIVPIPVAAAFGLVAFLSSPLAAAMSVIVPTVLSVVVGLCARFRRNLQTAVASGTVFILVCVTFAVLFTVYVQEGSISADSLINFAKQGYENMTSAFTDALTVSDGTQEITLVDSKQIAQFSRSAIALMPGLTVLVASLLVYISTRAHRFFLRVFGFNEKVSEDYLRFDMGLVSAFVYLAVLLLSFIFSLIPSAEIAYFSVENFKLILLMYFFITGCSAIRRFFSSKRPGFGILGCMTLMIFGFFAFSVIIYLIYPLATMISVIGALSVIKRKGPWADRESGK